jgi:hypothetical protein
VMEKGGLGVVDVGERACAVQLQVACPGGGSSRLMSIATWHLRKKAGESRLRVFGPPRKPGTYVIVCLLTKQLVMRKFNFLHTSLGLKLVHDVDAYP